MSHRPYAVPDNPVACPFCGTALLEGRFHSCPEMRDDVGVPAEPGPQDRIDAIVVSFGLMVTALIVIIVAMYLGSHLLVAAGVPCR